MLCDHSPCRIQVWGSYDRFLGIFRNPAEGLQAQDQTQQLDEMGNVPYSQTERRLCESLQRYQFLYWFSITNVNGHVNAGYAAALHTLFLRRALMTSARPSELCVLAVVYGDGQLSCTVLLSPENPVSCVILDSTFSWVLVRFIARNYNTIQSSLACLLG